MTTALLLLVVVVVAFMFSPDVSTFVSGGAVNPFALSCTMCFISALAENLGMPSSSRSSPDSISKTTSKEKMSAATKFCWYRSYPIDWSHWITSSSDVDRGIPWTSIARVIGTSLEDERDAIFTCALLVARRRRFDRVKRRYLFSSHSFFLNEIFSSSKFFSFPEHSSKNC